MYYHHHQLMFFYLLAGQLAHAQTFDRGVGITYNNNDHARELIQEFDHLEICHTQKNFFDHDQVTK